MSNLNNVKMKRPKDILSQPYHIQEYINYLERNVVLDSVSERYFKIEFTNVWGTLKEAIVKGTNKNTAYAKFKMKHGEQVNILEVEEYAH